MNDELNRLFFRETVQDSGVGDEKTVRQIGGSSIYAHVRVAVHALSRGRGNIFAWNAGSNIPAMFAPAVARGVQDAMNAGVLAGLDLIDVYTSIEDGSYHEEDSTTEAFREAAQKATVQALNQAQPMILESLSLVSVSVPEEFDGAVQASLISHGAEGLRSDIGSQAFSAIVPASCILGLIRHLLKITDGHAKFSIANSGFRPTNEPPGTAEQWVART